MADDGVLFRDANARRATLEFMRRFIKAHPKLFTASAATMLIRPFQDVIVPHLTGKVVNAGKSPSSMRRLIYILITVVVVLQVLQMASEVVDSRLVPSLQAFFRETVLTCMLHGTDGRMNDGDLRTGQVTTLLLKGANTLSYLFETTKTAVPNILIFIVSSVYLATIDPVLGLCAIVLVVITLLVVTYRVLVDCAQLSAEREKSFVRVHDVMDDVLNNVIHVQAYGRHSQEIVSVKDENAALVHLHGMTTNCAIVPQLWTVLPLSLAFMVGGVIRCGILVRNGSMSAGVFVSVFLVLLFMMQASLRVAQQTKTFAFHKAAVDSSLYDIMQKCGPPEVDDAHEDVLEVVDALEVDDDDDRRRMNDAVARDTFGLTNVSFGPLRNATVAFEMGQRTALLGPVGSGKSTILRLMAWLIEPDSGTVHMDGDAYGMTIDKQGVRGMVSYVPQTPTLFDRTLMENVLYGTPATEAEAMDLASELGAIDWFSAWSALEVGKGGSKLSGGQRQVALLMRALLSGKRIALLDEPTAAMDDETRDQMSAAIKKLDTAIIVTHDNSFAKNVATRVKIIVPTPSF